MVVWLFLFLSLAVQAKNNVNESDDQERAYQLMLIGSDLAFCRSSDLTQCNNQQLSELAFSFGRQATLYRVSPVQVERLMASRLWHFSRQAFRYDLNLVLLALAKTSSNDTLSKFQLVTLFRAIKVVSQGRHLSGYSLFSQLTAAELSMLFDHFEKPQIDSFTNRIKEKVNLTDKYDKPAMVLYNTIVEQARAVGQSKQPNILLITAGQRDPFKNVDSFISLFNQLGAKASWLPLDSALARLHDEKAGCEQLPSYRNNVSNNYQRARIYPDLVELQNNYCNQPLKMNEDITAADAVVFIGNSAVLLRNTFVNAKGQPSLALQLIESKMLNNKLFVASVGGATLAMTGGLDQNEQPVAMMVDGNSEMAFTKGTLTYTGCETASRCRVSDNRRVRYDPEGGLGLFKLGVIDSKITRESNFGRLAKVSFDSNNQLGIGLEQLTGLLVRSNKGKTSLKVVGNGGVTIVDHAGTVASNQAMELNNIGLNYLTPQDQAEISSDGINLSYANWKKVPLEFEGGVAKFESLFRSDNFVKFTQQACITKPKQWLGWAGKKHQFKIVLAKNEKSTVVFGGLMLDGTYKIYCSFDQLELSITRQR